MGTNWPKAGANHVPSYQVSGVPFVTSSQVNEVLVADSNSASTVIRVGFPFVTKALTIRNIGKNPLRVGFSERGIFAPGERLTSLHSGVAKPTDESRNYFIIPSSGSSLLAQDASFKHTFSFDIRCKEIYFLSNAAANSDPAGDKDNSGTGFSMLAELTTIPAGNFPILTGSLSSSAGTVEAFQGIG